MRTAARHRGFFARCLTHGLALGVLMLIAAGFRARSQDSVGAPDQVPVQALLVSAAATPQRSAELMPAVSSPPQPSAEASPSVSSRPHQGQFAPPVERWRSLSRDASLTVQQVTGVSLDEDLLLALVAVESEGQPSARSRGGAVGLTQVEPATFKELQARYAELLRQGSLGQPRVNLLAGALYLADCARILGADVTDPGDLALLLHAYNLGPRAAAQWRATRTWLDQTVPGARIEDTLPAETVAHAERIIFLYDAARM